MTAQFFAPGSACPSLAAVDIATTVSIPRAHTPKSQVSTTPHARGIPFRGAALV